MLKIFKTGWRSSFVRSVGVLAGGTAVSQAMMVLAMPVVTRLYTPSDYGVAAVFSSLVMWLGIVAAFRYDVAIAVAATQKQAASVVLLCGPMLVLSGVAVAILSFGAGGFLVDALQVPALAPYIWLLPIAVVALGAYRTLSYWAVRQERYGDLAFTKISQASSKLFIQIGGGFLVPGPLFLLLGHVAGTVSGIRLLSGRVWSMDRHSFQGLRRPDLAAAARRFRHFPLLSSWSALANSAGLHVPPLFVAGLYGASHAGQFGLALAVLASPMQMVGRSVANVYLGRLGVEIRAGGTHLGRLHLRITRSLLLLGIAPAAAVIMLGPRLFSTVFGADWEPAGSFARLLAPMILTQFVVSSTSQALVAIERFGRQLVWDVIRLASVATTFGVAYYFDVGASLAVAAYSGVMTALYIALGLLVASAISRQDRVA